MTFRFQITTLAFWCAVVIAGIQHNLPAQTQFEKTRSRLQQQLEPSAPSGTTTISKQFRRWEWFWEPRLLEDGSFPSPSVNAQALDAVRTQKNTDQTLAAPVWKEIGPIGKQAGMNTGWNGIGRINCIEFSLTDNNVMFAGSAAGGIWKTTNGGGLWNAVDVPLLPVFGVSDIAIAPSNANIMYVATGDVNAARQGDFDSYSAFSYGIIKSTDAGKTWSKTGLSYNADNNTLVARVSVHPTNPDIIVAATYSGMQISTNGGATWVVTAGGAFRDLVRHTTNPNILFASTFSGAGGAAVYKTTDGGATWVRKLGLNQANRIRLAVTKNNPSIVMFVSSRALTQGLNSVHISEDTGEEFFDVSPEENLLGWEYDGSDGGRGGQGFYDLAMTISPRNSQIVFIGGINTWKSDGGGIGWRISSHWFGDRGAPWVHADNHYMAYHPNLNKVFICHDGGIAVSQNDGATWADISNGLKVQQYYGITTSEQAPNLILSGSQDNGTALSTDNGINFAHVLDGDGMEGAVDIADGRMIYASQYNGSFYRSDNSGLNFNFISNMSRRGESASWVAPIVTDPQTSRTVYVGYQNVWKSTNRGVDWKKISSFGLSANSPLKQLAVSPNSSQVIYASSFQRLFKTTDGGNVWTEISGVPGVIQHITVHPGNPNKIWLAIGGYNSSNKVFELNGTTFTNLTGNGLPNVPVNTILYQTGVYNRLVVGTDIGVFAKTDSTSIWSPLGQGMPAAIITDLEYTFANGKLRASTYGRGVWEIEAPICVAAVPQISAVTELQVCTPDTVVLKVNGLFPSRTWSNGDTTEYLRLTNPNQSGTYSVSVEDANGCRNKSLEVSVKITRSPNKPQVTVRNQDTLRVVSVSGITEFQWYKNGVRIPGINRRDFAPTESGYYTVQVFNADNCTSVSDSVFFNITSVTDYTLATKKLTLFPNPVQDEITVSCGTGEPTTVEIFSMTGQLLLTQECSAEKDALTLNVSGLASGHYMVRTQCGRTTQMATFVK